MKRENADMIENRLTDLGAQIIFLSEALAPTRAAQHIAQQTARRNRAG